MFSKYRPTLVDIGETVDIRTDILLKKYDQIRAHPIYMRHNTSVVLDSPLYSAILL